MPILAGWRTVLFNVLSGAVVIAQGAMGKNVIPDEVLTLIIVVGNLVLRYYTTTPIGTRG